MANIPLVWEPSPYKFLSLTPSRERKKITYNNSVGESNVERIHAFQILDLSRRKRDGESLDVLQHMFNFPATDNREDIGRFVEEVSNGN
jgi:hypothetical protein